MSEQPTTDPAGADTTPPAPAAPASAGPAISPDDASAFLSALQAAVRAQTPEPTPESPATTRTAPVAGVLPVGTVVRFTTVDKVTGLPLAGLGLVSGHLIDVDGSGNPLQAVVKVTPLPDDYLLLGADDSVEQVA